jgi:hypothetical protein
MFCISLDFELAWGQDHDFAKKHYLPNLQGAKNAATQILKTFEEYEISATWACVGALYVDNIDILTDEFKKISYQDKNLSPMRIVEMKNELQLDIFNAKEIIDKIASSKNQEVATHTFTHLYCLEEGVKKEHIDLDIKLFKQNFPYQVSSIVFPRNQVDANAINWYGGQYSSYRGCYPHWAYQPNKNSSASLLKRGFRLLDSYLPLTRLSVELDFSENNKGMVNIPGTCFLRANAPLSKLHFARIKWAMTNAAKKNQLFHLWWHPHNFGINTSKSIIFLEGLIAHYKYLEERYNMKNLTMKEICENRAGSK